MSEATNSQFKNKGSFTKPKALYTLMLTYVRQYKIISTANVIQEIQNFGNNKPRTSPMIYFIHNLVICILSYFLVASLTHNTKRNTLVSQHKSTHNIKWLLECPSHIFTALASGTTVDFLLTDGRNRCDNFA